MYVSQDASTCIREVLPNQETRSCPDYEQLSNHRQLLRYLHDEIAQPIERPETDYVMTQAFAEYIRCYAPHHFDGISYRSVQHPGGINYALFAIDNAERVRSPYSRPAFDLVIAAIP
ncbi:unnamed protein product, partial [Mesorhabditis spiculigera]